MIYILSRCFHYSIFHSSQEWKWFKPASFQLFPTKNFNFMLFMNMNLTQHTWTSWIALKSIYAIATSCWLVSYDRWHWTSHFSWFSNEFFILSIIQLNRARNFNSLVCQKFSKKYLIERFQTSIWNEWSGRQPFCNWYTSILFHFQWKIVFCWVKETSWVTKHIRLLLWTSFNHSYVHQNKKLYWWSILNWINTLSFHSKFRLQCLQPTFHHHDHRDDRDRFEEFSQLIHDTTQHDILKWCNRKLLKIEFRLRLRRFDVDISHTSFHIARLVIFGEFNNWKN
jgi:hypothetical protein